MLGTGDTGTNRTDKFPLNGLYILSGKQDKSHASQGNKVETTSDNVQCHKRIKQESGRL